ITVGAPSRAERSSPSASGWPCQSRSSASPPAARSRSQTHSPAIRTSSARAASALTLGMRRNSASSSNQGSATAAESSALRSAGRNRVVVVSLLLAMFTAGDDLVLLALLGLAAALIVAAQASRTPYPILLVLGGLGLASVPGIPKIELPPDLVLVAVLPPLLYGSAFFTSLREFRANARPIALMAVGLVLITMLVVAFVAHTVIPGLSWPGAFVLGAIVSPTDPTAATTIAQRLGLPRRLISVIEGESLVNDGTALVAYRFA